MSDEPKRLDSEPFVCVSHENERRDSDAGLCAGWNRRIFRPRREFEQDGAKYPGLIKRDGWGWSGTVALVVQHTCPRCEKPTCVNDEIVLCECDSHVRACVICGCTPADLAGVGDDRTGRSEAVWAFLFNHDSGKWACPADTYQAFGWSP